MQERLTAMLEQARKELESAIDPRAIDAVRVRILGKKGELSAVLRGMGTLSAEAKRSVGEIANQVKAELEKLLAAADSRAEEARLLAELSGKGLDVSLAGRRQPLGKRHPVSRTLEEITEVFHRMGFELATGPEIELDYYNFEALNFPPDHPARDMQDTFIVDETTVGPGIPKGSVLLRTHTSPVQIREMLKREPPVHIICPGRVYRCDSDITHTPMFHQVEGLLVDKDVTFADLKGTLDAFARGFFGEGVRTRLRPSYFPFTEPSAEVDVTCLLCKGVGCRVCKNSGWLEVLGAGMVHPNVFKSTGYQRHGVTGFAFGMGVERLAMLRYGIDDLRTLFENDSRFLAQF
jgi:phenylalanyl-tRNA synthetase alpha chain